MTGPFPLDVHVFENCCVYYLFDVRNYSILKLCADAAAVASRMASYSLEEIINELSPAVSEPVIRAYYAKFLNMILAGTLSSEPLVRPSRPPFHRLVLMLAGGCNMACRYCFEKDVPTYQNTNPMTSEQADKILEWYFCHQQGPNAHIQLYGGEPLLNWDVLTHVVIRIEDRARENGKHLTKYLITNGTLLNPERIAFLKEHHVTTQISVDGDAETHNRFRVFKSGKSTMERILPNIREADRVGLDYNLRAVITHQNRSPQCVVAGLRSHGAQKVSFEVVATKDCADAQFSQDDWNEFNHEYSSYIQEAYTSWTHLPHDMQSMIIRICDNRHVHYGCGAGINEVTVAPDGSIYECQRMYRGPYSDVSHDKSPVDLASRFLTMVDERPVCHSCWARYLCGGGCMHQSYVSHGSSDPVPQFCTMKRNLAEASIVKIQQMRALNRVPSL
jgi:uncharacterized protein